MNCRIKEYNQSQNWLFPPLIEEFNTFGSSGKNRKQGCRKDRFKILAENPIIVNYTLHQDTKTSIR
ncbi:MAG: hypothetical protein ACK5MD_10405 [Flavobacteriales bacterium]